jgi:hypothetical protein
MSLDKGHQCKILLGSEACVPVQCYGRPGTIVPKTTTQTTLRYPSRKSQRRHDAESCKLIVDDQRRRVDRPLAREIAKSWRIVPVQGR